MSKKAAPKESTELSLPERASVALNSSETEKRLTELSTEFKSITAITNKDGRAECHTALMVLVNARTTIEKTAKAAREDATKFSKAVIAEEKRLIDIVAPEETRLAALRDEWDEKKEKERREAEEAERQRIQALRDHIADIRNTPTRNSSASIDDLNELIDAFENAALDADYFGDLIMEVKIAHRDAVAELRTLVQQKIADKAEAERREAERIALEEQRAEQARVAAEQEAARLAILADQQRIADEQAAAQAAIKAQQDAIDAENVRIQQERDDLAAKQLAIQEEIDKKLSVIYPEHEAIDTGPVLTATETRERIAGAVNNLTMPAVDKLHEAAIQNMNAEQILNHVYLPTNVELYTYLHTCTMEKYGLDKAEARRIIIEMAKAMKT